MKQEQFTTIIIESDEGNFLTQSADVDILKRIICKKVALGRNDSPNNWREISAKEADEFERERTEAEKKRIPPEPELT